MNYIINRKPLAVILLAALVLSSCSVINLDTGMPDPVLSACVKAKLTTLESNDLSAIKELTCKGLELITVKDLTGLSNLSSLEKLQLQYNEFESLAGMGNMPSLKEIHLSGNKKLISLEGLEGAINLEKLSVTRAKKLTDITAISTLYRLKYFGALLNNISDLSAFTHLNNLEKVVLNYNNITDVSPLAKKPKLKWLEMHSNPITSIEPLLTNKNMTTVGFAGAMLKDCSNVQKLRQTLSGDARIFPPENCNK